MAPLCNQSSCNATVMKEQSPTTVSHNHQPAVNSTKSTPPVMALLPSMLEISQVKTPPTIQHVPKRLRNKWAVVLSKCIEDIVNNHTKLDLWANLFMLPKCTLTLPPRAGAKSWREREAIIRGNLGTWTKGDFTPL